MQQIELSEVPIFGRGKWFRVVSQLRPGKAMAIPLNGSSVQTVRTSLRYAAKKYKMHVGTSGESDGQIYVWLVDKNGRPLREDDHEER